MLLKVPTTLYLSFSTLCDIYFFFLFKFRRGFFGQELTVLLQRQLVVVHA